MNRSASCMQDTSDPLVVVSFVPFCCRNKQLSRSSPAGTMRITTTVHCLRKRQWICGSSSYAAGATVILSRCQTLMHESSDGLRCGARALGSCGVPSDTNAPACRMTNTTGALQAALASTTRSGSRGACAGPDSGPRHSSGSAAEAGDTPTAAGSSEWRSQRSQTCGIAAGGHSAVSHHSLAAVAGDNTKLNLNYTFGDPVV